jgi:hypothetical protein
VAYVVVLAVWVDGVREPRPWLVGLAALAVAAFAARRGSGIARVLSWGLAVVVASLGAEGESRGLDVCGGAAAMACVLGATFALANMPFEGGLVRPRAASAGARSRAIALAAVWWTALVARAIPPGTAIARHLTWMVDYPEAWALGAALTSALALYVTSERTVRRRGLELGVVERALAIRALLGLAFAAALVVGVLGSLLAHATARLFVALASVAVGVAATYPDAVRVARATRRLVVLALLGGAVALVGASAASDGGGHAATATICAVAVALAVGAFARSLEGQLRPARGVWLDAFEHASAEAGRADPDEAIRGVLAAVRAAGGAASVSPELWSSPPTRVSTVDAAGYLHERDAELPEALLRVAVGEPQSTLRAAVLDALEVRRPELRVLAKWMIDRDALLATVVEGDGEAEGILVLPRATRPTSEPPTLEEVRALKAAADRLAVACRTRATYARMLERAHEATKRADAAEERMDRLRHERDLDVGRDALATMRLARPATVGVYAASSRMALEALERRTSVGAPIAVVAPTGVDPVPFLARAHLAGVRRDAPLVLVDATSAREHDVARWSDPRSSPLALADRGMLVLLDGAALPAEVQQLVARSLTQKRTPWERPDPLDVQLAMTAVLPPDDLVAASRLDPSLALRLGEAQSEPVALPRLRDRPEDLRAILTDRLAREGLRVLGRPVGIEQAAFARLVDYPFPGEDAELGVIVQRLVARCRGEVVRAADIDALRLLAETRPETQTRGRRRKDPLSA